MNLHRRHLLTAALAAPASLTLAPALAQAQPNDARFVFVVLRGAMDGLGAVPAIGDPEFAAARGALAHYTTAPRALAGTPFALHPMLETVQALYQQQQAIVMHAVGLAYQDRSHFDAQQVLESGASKPYELSTGWIGRALAAQTQAAPKALALMTAVPLVLRGSDNVDTWAPSALPEPMPDLVARLDRLYAATDPTLAQALQRAKTLRDDPAMAASMAGGSAPGRGNATALAKKAGEMLSATNGSRIAVLELAGWDTHANQGASTGQLANQLRNLDGALAALKESLGASWNRTVVLVATEFGREVAINGTGGTDHGTGGAALLLGGAVKGGKVITDWPGLAKAQRHEGRDLKVTTDLRAVVKGVLADHLRWSSAVIEKAAFPGSADIKGLKDLVRGV
jgi:uncharacterized protein (DUF1501 family)